MDTLTIIYFVYMFIALYITSLSLVLLFKIRKTYFFTPKITKEYSVSVIIPAWNEENCIQRTVNSVNKLDYKNIKEIIVVNDGSTDNTLKILTALKKDIPNLRILNKKNSGKADSLNQAIKIAKGELICIVDSETVVRKNALSKTVGYFDDQKMGAVTVPILIRNPKNLLARLQRIEYVGIALTRKLLEPIDSIYVTPGPFALYRKSVLEDIGGFDPENITEDIELTWSLASKGYKRMMNMETGVTTIAPSSFKVWWKQRNRWTMGGIQTFLKYKKHFAKENMFGYFILPFFGLGFLLGLLGLFIFAYQILRNLWSRYFLVKYSLIANIPIISTESLFQINPSVLNYFGIALFVLMFFFNIIIIRIVQKKLLKGKNFKDFLLFITGYLLLSPIIFITAMFKFLRKDMKW